MPIARSADSRMGLDSTSRISMHPHSFSHAASHCFSSGRPLVAARFLGCVTMLFSSVWSLISFSVSTPPRATCHAAAVTVNARTPSMYSSSPSEP